MIKVWANRPSIIYGEYSDFIKISTEFSIYISEICVNGTSVCLSGVADDIIGLNGHADTQVIKGLKNKCTTQDIIYYVNLTMIKAVEAYLGDGDMV